ncbi:MAG: HNH endonuclease signature motif containing protein [Dermatophilaceae bacterium]
MITAAQVDAEQELASLCGVLNASYARLVAIVAGALVDESWAIAGVRSPEHWLTMRAGLSPFRARQVVAVARRAGELPSVMGEFADGQLSLDQVMVVARYAPAHVEASVAEFAVHASVPQLRRALSHYSFDPPAEPGHAQSTTTRDDNTGTGNAEAGNAEAGNAEAGDAEAGDAEAGNKAAGDIKTGDTAAGGTTAGDPPGWNGFALVEDRAGAPAELSMSYDEWGRFTMRFSAPADLGALVEAALNEGKDALFRAGRPEVTFGDAMVEIAQRSLGAVTSINRRDAFRTYVHLDTEGGWLTGKPRLPAHLVDKLTCDGILQPVWHTQGAPVNVGRAQRIVPTRTRRLVEDRDRGCRFPGCPATAHCECHHLIHWVDGGPTDTWNLCCLCPFHHGAHHDGEFTVSGNANNPGGLTFTTKSGFPIRSGPTFTTPIDPQTPRDPSAAPYPPGSPSWDTSSSPALPPGSTSPAAPPPPLVAAYRGPSGDTLSLRWVTFGEPRKPALV